MIVTPIDDVARLIERHGCGLVVRDADPSDLAAKVDAVASDPALLARLRAGARAAAAELTWDRERERVADVYRCLLGDAA